MPFLFLAEIAPFSYESLGVTGLLAAGLVVVWRLNTQLARKNEKLQEDHVAKSEAATAAAESRAEKHAQIIQDNTEALRVAAQATRELTRIIDAHTRVVEIALAKLEGSGR